KHGETGSTAHRLQPEGSGPGIQVEDPRIGEVHQGLDAGEDRLPDPLTGRSGRIAAWGGQPPPTQPARDDPGHWAILPRATSAALQEGRPLRVQALELGPELGVAGEVRVVTDDPPGVLVGRDDEVLVAGQPEQSDAASCP